MKYPTRVMIQNNYVLVEHDDNTTEAIPCTEILEITLRTTDMGPFAPDVFLVITGEKARFMLPHDVLGYDELYEAVSHYPGFSFTQAIEAMSCTDNKDFVVWTRS